MDEFDGPTDEGAPRTETYIARSPATRRRHADTHMHPIHMQPQACRYGALTGCMPENCLLVAMKVGQTIRPPTPLDPLSFQCLGPPVFFSVFTVTGTQHSICSHRIFSFPLMSRCMSPSAMTWPRRTWTSCLGTPPKKNFPLKVSSTTRPSSSRSLWAGGVA